MLSLLLVDDLMPFHLSVLFLCLLSMAETLGYYIGLRPSSFFKKIVPHWLSHSPLLQVKFSKVLILVFLLINFSAAGYLLQLISFAYHAHFMAWYFVLLPAMIIASFFTAFMIHCLDQVIRPKLATKQTRLLGRLATISSGTARPGFSAQARIRDEYGQMHYVQVEPEFGELEFQSQILLIRFKKSHYIAKKIAPSNHLFNADAFEDLAE